jgi:hypothetical protein
MSVLTDGDNNNEGDQKITYTIIYDILKYSIVYKCQTINCVLYGEVGDLNKCSSCGQYRRMIKIYTTRPKPPIISIV